MMQTYFFALRFRIPPDGMNPRRFPERFSVLRLAGFGALHFLVGVVCTDFPANSPVNFFDGFFNIVAKYHHVWRKP